MLNRKLLDTWVTPGGFRFENSNDRLFFNNLVVVDMLFLCRNDNVIASNKQVSVGSRVELRGGEFNASLTLDLVLMSPSPQTYRVK